MSIKAKSWPVFAVPGAVVFALVGMAIAGAQHALIGASTTINVLVGISMVAALVGAIGGLVLANVRRNVMWILPVALATTALLALIAIVISSLTGV